ncbi:histone RNA hairpin-binding protein [Plakobranchus ocellatus]|uniref:Histone RNA hairpin-binding protein n=1 Tax=Plakobranchus ocellatus TaxID=259542 RepID=A0AAV4CSY4_9GAST|nr:histone RNA hairpin-binding protein [Plakobranchus ocellatus]
MDLLRQPPELDFSSTNGLAESWRKIGKWKQSMQLYLDLAMKTKSDEEKCTTFLYLIGTEGREIFNTFNLGEQKLQNLIDAFDNYC